MTASTNEQYSSMAARIDMSATATASFMGIPVELRLKIYEYLLSPYPKDVHSLYCRPHFEEHRICHGLGCPCSTSDVYPDILGTSPQVYHEAIETLY
jgi:hypothetical protein